MDIKISKNSNNIYFVELSGDFDLYSSHQIKNVVMKIIKAKVKSFIISLNGVISVNSAGIGALVYIFSTLKKLDCPLVVVAPEGPVMQALEVTRLKSYFTIVPSLQDALSLVGKEA